MNKSLITNTIALILLLVGIYINNAMVTTVGLFALSGAITNWLAVHMLFEKVPLLYGSGVIPARFEDFKAGIHKLIMEQFFTQQNIKRFMSEANQDDGQDNANPINRLIDKVDLTPAFEALVDVIKGSSFGGMLAMVGGEAALQPLKEPFMERMKATMEQIVKSPQINQAAGEEDSSTSIEQGLQQKIATIVESRLQELTPTLVKEIIQQMIKQHLGWLVVWGGVFGGLIGLCSALLMA